MPTEFFVRQFSAPEDLQSRERHFPPAVARSPAGSQELNSSTSLPALSQAPSLSGSHTSWRTTNGIWVHRASAAPYEKALKSDRQRLPKVLLARIGAWRPSNAAGKGPAPATVPEIKAMTKTSNSAELELDQRLIKLKEIFADASARNMKEWKPSPRLEELSKPRSVRTPAGLGFRDSPPPVEALIKKKRKPIHIPMSPKERLASAGSAGLSSQPSTADLATLDSRVDQILGKYDRNSPKGKPKTPKTPESSKGNQSFKPSPTNSRTAGTPTVSSTAGVVARAVLASRPMESRDSIDETSEHSKIGIVSQKVDDYEDDDFEGSSAAGPDRTYSGEYSGTYSADEFASFSKVSKEHESDEDYSDEDFDEE